MSALQRKETGEKVADTEILTKGCQAFGISVTERQTEQFLAYYDLLIEWNKVMNLTAITEFEEVMSKHFVDRKNWRDFRLPLVQRKKWRLWI